MLVDDYYPEPYDSTLQVTLDAANWIHEQLSKRGKGRGIRLGVAPAGCTGYKYIVEFVDQENEEDYIVQKKGLLFFIDPKSKPVLQGSVVEFKTEGINSGIEIINPNAQDKCGCGESFNI